MYSIENAPAAPSANTYTIQSEQSPHGDEYMRPSEVLATTKDNKPTISFIETHAAACMYYTIPLVLFNGIDSHRLITYCSHFLLNFQLPTGFVLVG